MPPNLVDKGLQQDALGTGLHVHGPEGWAHPPDAGGREKGEVAGSSGQCVLGLSSVPASVWPQLLSCVGQDTLLPPQPGPAALPSYCFSDQSLKRRTGVLAPAPGVSVMFAGFWCQFECRKPPDLFVGLSPFSSFPGALHSHFQNKF